MFAIKGLPRLPRVLQCTGRIINYGPSLERKVHEFEFRFLNSPFYYTYKHTFPFVFFSGKGKGKFFSCRRDEGV